MENVLILKHWILQILFSQYEMERNGLIHNFSSIYKNLLQLLLLKLSAKRSFSRLGPIKLNILVRKIGN